MSDSRSKSGNTWWSNHFLRSLERLGLSLGLPREREFPPEASRLLSFEVSASGVESRFAEMREYSCRIEFAPFTDHEWEESLERLAFMDLSAAAQLTTGRLPLHIEEFFLPTGRRLLPQQSEELEFSCSCSEPRKLCRHLVATARLFAEKLDRDPWLLFLVRGRSAQAVQAALAERWNRDTPVSDAAVPELSVPPPEPLTTDVDLFWEGTRPTDPNSLLTSGKLLPTVRRLGTPEPKVEEKAWTELMTEIYTTLSQRAQRRLQGE